MRKSHQVELIAGKMHYIALELLTLSVSLERENVHLVNRSVFMSSATSENAVDVLCQLLPSYNVKNELLNYSYLSLLSTSENDMKRLSSLSVKHVSLKQVACSCLPPQFKK